MVKFYYSQILISGKINCSVDRIINKFEFNKYVLHSTEELRSPSLVLVICGSVYILFKLDP